MKWFDNARTALFVHYGLGTENPNWEKATSDQFETIHDFENEAIRRGWSAKKWVQAAKKLRASYITLACFHCSLGYIKAWKSSIPGTKSFKTDFLRMLIDEAEKEEIKILVYISGEPITKFFYKDNPWIIPEEYSKYVGDENVNILDLNTWQSVYAKEIIREVIQNYPKVGGFWFDGWNSPSICADVFGMVHQYGEQYATIRNDFGMEPFTDEDRMSLECFGKFNEPSFDYGTGAWHTPGNAEYCYVIRELSDWWQYEPVPEDYDKQNALRIMTSVMAKGWTAKIGLGPTIGGDFNNALGKFLDDADNFLSYAGGSLIGCEPGGLPEGYYNDNAYGVTTCRESEGIYYIHLFLPPVGNTLLVPDGGITFTHAENLYNKKGLHLAANNGFIEITADFTSEITRDGVFIIKLHGTKKEAFIYDVPEYSNPLPCDILIKLDDSREISSLILHEDDNSAPIAGSWGSVENNRLEKYAVSISADGKNFTEITRGTLSGSRGIKQINFAPCHAKEIKFTALSPVTTGGYVKEFIGGNWAYSPLSTEPVNHSEPIEIDGSFITTVNGTKWDTKIELKQAAATKNQVVILGNEENMFLIDAGGTNICSVGVGADRIGVLENGNFFAAKDAISGNLRINKIVLV
jgi:Alpha-L-fucosidase.